MSLRRAIALLLLGMQSACYTGPRQIQYSPRQYLSANNPKKLWVTMNDGRRQVVTAPQVIADTVFGRDETGERDLTIPIADVRELQTRRLAVFRTALIPTAILAAGLTVFVTVKAVQGEAAISAAECPDFEGCDP